jgi:hypothetical protein
MKKKIIWIPLVIVVAACLAFYIYVYFQPTGFIKIDAAGAELQLQGGSFGRTKTVLSAGPVTVIAGAYRPQHLAVVTRQNGDSWRIESSGPWGKLEQIEVKENQTASIELGPPFVIKPEVRKNSPQQVSVGLAIIGQAGEQYRNVITKNNEPVPPPKVKIVDEAGTVLASGSFEYG